MSSRIDARQTTQTHNAHIHAPRVEQAMGLSDIGFLVLALMLIPTLAEHTGHALSHAETGISAMAMLAMLSWLNTQGHYRNRQPVADQLGALIKASVMAMLAVISVLWLAGHNPFTLSLLSCWAVVPFGLTAGRLMTRGLYQSLGLWRTPVTIFAPQSQSMDPQAILDSQAGHGLSPERSLALEPLASLSKAALATQLQALKGKTVFIAPDSQTQAIASRLVDLLTLHGISFYYRPAIGALPHMDVDLLDFPPADGLILSVRDPLNRPLTRSIKRLFDVTLSTLALSFLAPFLLAIAMLIRRDGGPAFFIQPRLGADGKAFGCLKFRTMDVNAEAKLAQVLRDDPEKAAEWAAYQKLSDDPRITPVGHILRKTSLDELPQLLNVLVGKMSLVGPRPMTLDQQDAYGDPIAAYKRLRPGITGLWQVNGRNATTFEERARLDAWYARNWSLWRDIVICLRTVREVCFSSGC